MLRSLPRLPRAVWSYLREARREMQKVNWPSRQEVLRMTVIVVVLSGIVAIILGGFDFVFTRTIVEVFSRGQGNGRTAPLEVTAEEGKSIEVEVLPEGQAEEVTE